MDGLATSTDDGPSLRTALERIARHRIYFGHQSVGANVMAGVEQLAAEERFPLRFVPVSDAVDVAPGTFAHGPVAANGAPLQKLASFAGTLGAAGGTGVDIALVKFCYADIGPETDVRPLFARYQALLVELRSRHPRTTFIHVTVPLVTFQRGLEARLKRLLGRPCGTADNARREQYNVFLRQAYVGREPVFDLARIESMTPSGKREEIEWEGRRVPVLVPAYTDDGGHLNRVGQRRAARELVAVLATVPDRSPS